MSSKFSSYPETRLALPKFFGPVPGASSLLLNKQVRPMLTLLLSLVNIFAQPTFDSNIPAEN
jgi:hypothetical protein